MSTTAALPEPAAVAARARDILAGWQADDEMRVVLAGCEKYSSDWDDFYGGPLISTYSVARDAGHLLGDALKVMALKSAMYEMTGDELAAELPVPVPVDVTCHALCAQFTALSRIQQRTGHLFVHSTVNEHVNDTPWRAGDYTHQAYQTAFGPVDERYRIDADEAERRRRILDGKYASIGITDRGMTSSIDYAAAV
ncbi:hypothetical protein ACPCIY_25770 [Streptomyces thermodiastaticus]